MWGRDGSIYFVSDRDGNGLTNIWRVADSGGKAEKVTSFRNGGVRFSSDRRGGRTNVCEHDFGIWKLDVGTKRATPVKLDIDAETQENDVEMRAFASEADDFDLAPNSRRLVVSVHGELFSVPVE